MIKKVCAVTLVALWSLVAQAQVRLVWNPVPPSQSNLLYKVYDTTTGSALLGTVLPPATNFALAPFFSTNATRFSVTSSNRLGESSNSLPAWLESLPVAPTGVQTVSIPALTVPLGTPIQWGTDLATWDQRVTVYAHTEPLALAGLSETGPTLVDIVFHDRAEGPSRFYRQQPPATVPPLPLSRPTQ